MDQVIKRMYKEIYKNIIFNLRKITEGEYHHIWFDCPGLNENWKCRHHALQRVRLNKRSHKCLSEYFSKHKKEIINIKVIHTNSYVNQEYFGLLYTCLSLSWPVISSPFSSMQMKQIKWPLKRNI